jgi:hypothetical protein
MKTSGMPSRTRGARINYHCLKTIAAGANTLGIMPNRCAVRTFESLHEEMAHFDAGAVHERAQLNLGCRFLLGDRNSRPT